MKKFLFSLAVLLIAGLIGLSGWFFWRPYHLPALNQKVDAAVILGTKTYIDGQINQCLLARLDTGISLIKTGQASALIMTGGRDSLNQPTQAQVMASLARHKGINPRIIWTENKSSDTWENILFARQIIVKNNWTKIAIVTEPYHMTRALMISKALGINSYPAPAVKSPCWQNNKLRLQLLGRDFLAFWQDYWRIFNEK
ncbi:MAG: YdcF family protein [bacterium]|nr:YdcF family protein [bacterium]